MMRMPIRVSLEQTRDPSGEIQRWWLLTDAGGTEVGRIYNVTERAAAQADSERRIVEERERTSRVNTALSAATRTKRAAIDALRHKAPQLDTRQLEAVTQAFETLRERAEATVAIEEGRSRRPSWAPPLTLEGELLELCRAIGYLQPDDPPIARFWASYANPKRSGRILRETISTLPLTGIPCRGFQLFAGSERGNTNDLLFEAQRAETGVWRFGPQLFGSHFWSPHTNEWHRLAHQRAEAEDRIFQGKAGPGDPDLVASLSERLAAIDALDLTIAGERRLQSEQRTRVVQLAQQRVLEFVGAPDAQMQLAARLCGHCCCCFKELTDPISLERGIGPECHRDILNYIRAYSSRPIDWLTKMTGMPHDFVVATIEQTSRAQLELAS